MKDVLMLGNDPSVKGGITTVINQFKEHKWENVRLEFIPTYKDNNAIVKILFFLIAYIRIIFKFIFSKPDIVHMHMSYKASFTRAYMIHKLCKFFNIKDIIHLHGSEFKKWYDSCKFDKKEKIKKLLRECYIMVVLGAEWESRIKKIEPNTNILVVNNKVKLQNEFVEYSNEYFNVLFLGVLIKRKGINDLLEAIRILKNRNSLNNIKFIITGNGEEENKLKKLAKLYNINESIIFTGWINGDKKNDIIKKSHLMVLPSYNEGLPMSILESMSFGLPIIATNVGDVSEAVINERNGYLVDVGNPIMLANCIEKIIRMPKDEWERMSNESKKIINAKFSDSNYFDIFEKIY